MSFLGQTRKIAEISTLDLQSYRRKLQNAYSTAHRMNLHRRIMNAMFNWAKINNTKVVITREHYMPFAYYDLLKAGYKETDKTPGHIKAAIRAMPPVKPKMD